MPQARIQLSQGLGDPIPANTFPDFAWAKENENALLQAYGEGVALIFEQSVIGVGQTLEEALTQAEKMLLPETAVITPILYYLAEPNPFMRATLRRLEPEA